MGKLLDPNQSTKLNQIADELNVLFDHIYNSSASGQCLCGCLVLAGCVIPGIAALIYPKEPNPGHSIDGIRPNNWILLPIFGH